MGGRLDSKQIGQQLLAGHRVRVGAYVTLQVSEDELVLRCDRCKALRAQVPWKPMKAFDTLGSVVQFVRDHQHDQPA